MTFSTHSRRYVYLGVAAALIAIVALGAFLYAPSDEADIAARVGRMADTLAERASLNIPGVKQAAAFVIGNQLRQRMTWSYSQPAKTGEHQYEMRVTAAAPFDIDLIVLKRSVDISGDFVLQIDTQKQQVTSWQLDPVSFALRERDQ